MRRLEICRNFCGTFLGIVSPTIEQITRAVNAKPNKAIYGPLQSAGPTVSPSDVRLSSPITMSNYHYIPPAQKDMMLPVTVSEVVSSIELYAEYAAEPEVCIAYTVHTLL